MSDQTFDENPWSAEFWNLTRQGAYIRKHGLEVAKTKAKRAGTTLGAPMPRAERPKLIVLVQRRDVSGSGGGGGGGGGGLVGAGSSGNGPPA